MEQQHCTLSTINPIDHTARLGLKSPTIIGTIIPSSWSRSAQGRKPEFTRTQYALSYVHILHFLSTYPRTRKLAVSCPEQRSLWSLADYRQGQVLTSGKVCGSQQAVSVVWYVQESSVRNQHHQSTTPAPSTHIDYNLLGQRAPCAQAMHTHLHIILLPS